MMMTMIVIMRKRRGEGSHWGENNHHGEYGDHEDDNDDDQDDNNIENYDVDYNDDNCNHEKVSSERRGEESHWK